MEATSPNLARLNVHAVQAAGQLLSEVLLTSVTVKVTDGQFNRRTASVCKFSCMITLTSHGVLQATLTLFGTI